MKHSGVEPTLQVPMPGTVLATSPSQAWISPSLCPLGDLRCLRLRILEVETETGICDSGKECFSEITLRERLKQ